MKFWQITAWLGAVAIVGLIALVFMMPLPGGSKVVSIKVDLPPPAFAGPDANTIEAKAFLTELYSHYQDSKVDFTPLFDKAPDYFDPSLLALIRQDQKLSNGEILAFEADPICDCQDYDKISADIRILSVTATTAKAGVILTDTGQSPRSMAYDLVKVDGHWRIHDISSPAYPSLRQDIVNADKAAR